MSSPAVSVLLGISLGLMIGIVPVLVVGVISFAYRYTRGDEVPLLTSIVVSLPVAGGVGLVLGAGLGALDAGIVERVGGNLPSVVVAAIVVVLLGLYAQSQATELASRLPRDTAQPTQRARILSPDVLDDVDGAGQVAIRTSGEIGSIEGYPPLPPGLRASLRDRLWRIPSDLPIREIESRLEDRLLSQYDLAAVSVSVDSRGRATIAVAPPSNGVAERVPDGHRAVSLETYVPAGVSRGDDVIVAGPSGQSTATILGVDDGDRDSASDRNTTAFPIGGGTDGGRGRITVAVPTTEAGPLLKAGSGQIAVTPHGTSHEFEAFSLLERAGQSVRRVVLDEATIDAVLDEDTDVRIFAVRKSDSGQRDDDSWSFDPDRATLTPGTTAFVVGGSGTLDRVFGRGHAAGPTEVAQ